MKGILESNIGRRLLLLATVSMLPVLIAMVIAGWLAIDQSQAQISRENQALAQSMKNHLDYVLQQSLEELNSLQFTPGFDISDDDIEPERVALHNIYLGSIFDSVFFTDSAGVVLWQEPASQGSTGADFVTYEPVALALQSNRPIISNVYYLPPDDKAAVFLISTFHNRGGQLAGLVGGYIRLDESHLSELLGSTNVGKTTYLTDSRGVLIAGVPLDNSAEPDKDVTTETVFLDNAPWALSVSEMEGQALSPIRTMETRFIMAGSISLVLVFFLSLGMASSLVKPIGKLKEAAVNISRGDLSLPVPSLGSDEIGELGRSFDTMRQDLKNSVEKIQEWNRQLEVTLEERTRQLRESYDEIERKEIARRRLLRKVLIIQEEERKRMARELHDETTQMILGLVMRLESTPEVLDDETGQIKSKLEDIKGLALNILDSVHKIIFNLRPSVLDDLGLLSALRWYAQNRLDQVGIKARIEVSGEEKELPPQIEIAVFRVAQEAITNIVKHSQAHNVLINVEYQEKSIVIEIEDDGRGFELEKMTSPTPEGQGMGLMGMRERVELLGGSFEIESYPDQGTQIAVKIPLDIEEENE